MNVIGELNVANLARVKLFVQAKRYGVAKVSGKPVRDLRKVIPQGCQGAVITTSGFDSKAREAALDPGFAPIGLIDGHQLMDLLVEHWNAEPLLPFPRSVGPQARPCAGLMCSDGPVMSSYVRVTSPSVNSASILSNLLGPHHDSVL